MLYKGSNVLTQICTFLQSASYVTPAAVNLLESQCIFPESSN